MNRDVKEKPFKAPKPERLPGPREVPSEPVEAPETAPAEKPDLVPA
jgi:hypothetical protein